MQCYYYRQSSLVDPGALVINHPDRCMEKSFNTSGFAVTVQVK